MKRRAVGWVCGVSGLILFLHGVPTPAQAPAPAAPKQAAPAAAANRLPRTLDGKPDFSGIWQSFTTADEDSWSFEMGAPALLLRKGWKKDAVAAGAQVTVSGYHARSGLPVASCRSVKLADGRDMFGGSSGDPVDK